MLSTSSRLSFRFGAHEERDQFLGDGDVIILVSIHALTRSATSTRTTPVATQSGFNPRAHEERDGAMLTHCFMPIKWHSTANILSQIVKEQS